MSFNLNKVLISDSVDVSCRQILEEGGITVDYKAGVSKEVLLSIIKVEWNGRLWEVVSRDLLCVCAY